MKKEKIEISLDDLKVTNEAAYFLHQASGWGKFLAIIGFIAYGLLILFFLIAAIAATGGNDFYFKSMHMGGMANPHMGAMLPGMAWVFFAIMLIVLGIMMIPLFYLYGFAEKAKNAIKLSDPQILAQSLRSLKNLFVFYGVLMIIYLAFLAFAFLIGSLGALFA